MKIHVLIALLIIGTAAIGTVRAADNPASEGLEALAIKPNALSVVADQTRSLTPKKPLETVLETIKKVLPGRALDARLVDRSGRQAYEIRWMGDNGKVSDITADAQSGEIVDKR